MVEVSTSLLNVKRGKEAETIIALEKAKTDYFHIDVMDGKFVKKDTYKYMKEIVSYIKRISNIPIDVHLMVEDLNSAIEDFITIEPNIVTFHLEACKDEQEVMNTIKLIKNAGCKVGISVKPNTSIEEVYKYLPFVHLCLVMTVEPGLGGQTLLSDMVDKIKVLKTYIEQNNLEVDIEADGGINLATYKKVVDAGANVIVSGTAILMADNFKIIIDELKS